MADDTPGLSRRTGSSPLRDRPQPVRRQSRNSSPRQFAEIVRHIPLHDRDRVHFVDEPEEFGPYDTATGNPYDSIPPPGIQPVQGHVSSQNVYANYSAPYSRVRGPTENVPVYATPWSGRQLSRRSTGDSYVSDRGQPIALATYGRGRVRFAEPETRRAAFAASPPPPPPPMQRATRDEYLPDSEDVEVEEDDVRLYSTPPASYRSRSRSRSRANRLYESSYVDEVDEDEDDEEFDELLGGKVFQFVPSRASRALSKSGQSIDTELSFEKSEDGTLSSKDEPNIPHPPGNILHVYQSQYTGDAMPDGSHTAKLTVIHDQKKQRQPLFRWMHLEQPVMNLDELSAEIARIPAITDSERNGFAKLLAEVKRSSVKFRPTSKGSNVRHIDPKPIRVTIAPDGRAKDQTSRPLTWLCVPYFSLERYSGLLSAKTASHFPVETLLQSEYARTTQERDMQQAVCQNGEVSEGDCFHIAQLWCIVLDNSLLITCGRMSSTSLRGDLVRIFNEPFKQPAGKAKAVYISYYDNVLWALPLESCSTWFDFMIHFREFWPQAIKVYHHGHVVTATDWPRIVNTVKKVNTKVVLDLRLSFHPQPPAIGVLTPQEGAASEDGEEASGAEQPSSSQTQAKTPNKADNKFHVFSWLEMAESEDENAGSNSDGLITHLQEAEEYLTSSTTIRDRKAYNNCISSSQRSVYGYLRERGSKLGETDEEIQAKRDYENGVDLYNAADIIFCFFLPKGLNRNMPTADKFWGAIRSLVEMDGDGEDHLDRPKPLQRRAGGRNNVHGLRSSLRGMTRVIQSFQDIVSHAPAPIRTRVEVPDSLIRAWLHLVMAIIQASLGEFWTENMMVAEALIRSGMNDIIDEIPTEDLGLLPSSVLQPMDLVALVSLKLLQDSTGKYPSIDDTYSDYLKGLENEITTNNSDRSHQFRITLFKQEIAAIRRVVASQLKVADGMVVPQKASWGDQTRREREMLEREREKSKVEPARLRSRSYEKQGMAYVDRADGLEVQNHYSHRSVSGLPAYHFAPIRAPDAFAKLASTDPGGFRELLGRECRSWLERRENELYELDVEASRLENMNANKIEVTKDRQEAAVYAFTMVTIIFLPLSTISSIFGMNSSDLRDMEQGQWAYWAAAIPTTIAVIIMGLWWMGELRNLVNWVRGLPSRGSRGGRGYARVSQPAAANGVIYYPQAADYPGMMDPPAMRPYSRATFGLPVPRPSWRH